MSAVERPVVECTRQHTGLSVPDVRVAADWYVAKLGFTPGFVAGDPPDFAGVSLGEAQLFLRQGTPAPEGSVVFFVIEDVDALYEYHRAQGVEIAESIGDREYGIRDYVARDLHGHYLSFGQYIYSVGEKIPIERVDVSVRLEKRLAALLGDLAAYKRMSLTSLLEEILLHTNEPLGDGVASPHTKSQLRRIQELKREHGIDYDSHASYRWVER